MAEKPITTEQEPNGIGGWLLLPMIGLILTPIRGLVSLIVDVMPAFEPKVWAALTTPGSRVYHPSTEALLIFELTINILFILAALALLYFFFTKSRHLPKLMIAWLLATTALIAIDTLWSAGIPLVYDNSTGFFYGDLLRSIIAAAIWVPYFNVSKRVKNTFVN